MKKHNICFGASVILFLLGMVVFIYFRAGINRISPNEELGMALNLYSEIGLLASAIFLIIGLLFYVRQDMQ